MGICVIGKGATVEAAVATAVLVTCGIRAPVVMDHRATAIPIRKAAAILIATGNLRAREGDVFAASGSVVSTTMRLAGKLIPVPIVASGTAVTATGSVKTASVAGAAAGISGIGKFGNGGRRSPTVRRGGLALRCSRAYSGRALPVLAIFDRSAPGVGFGADSEGSAAALSVDFVRKPGLAKPGFD
jgi:hypothetical protein